MSLFYERYVLLCSEHKFKPQSPQALSITGVSSPAVSGWKKGALPKGEIICKLAKYFNVSSDYLLGLSELRNNNDLNEKEKILINAYRQSDDLGQINIIYNCMNEMNKKKISPN